MWAASATWLGREHPGSRQMWVSVLFLVVFAGLLSVTSLWLWRRRPVGEGGARHAGARGLAAGRHASA
jgi:putative exporter of polyketide antibiotics